MEALLKKIREEMRTQNMTAVAAATGIPYMRLRGMVIGSSKFVVPSDVDTLARFLKVAGDNGKCKKQ